MVRVRFVLSFFMCLFFPVAAFAQQRLWPELSPDSSAATSSRLNIAAPPPSTGVSILAVRRAGAASGILADPAPVAPPQGPPASGGYVFPSGSKMAKNWLIGMFGPRALFGSAFGATWGTWVLNSPEEWGKGGEGWSKRFGNSLADNAVNTTTLYAVSAAMRQDPIYYKCPCTGFGPRLGHVIKMTFMSRNQSGHMVFSPGKTFSPFVGPMVTRNTIYPDKYDSRDAAISGAWNVSINAGWNFAREFFPFMRAPQW
jgi:hypothetical protein